MVGILPRHRVTLQCYGIAAHQFIEQITGICEFEFARLMQINAQLTHGLLQEITLQNLKRGLPAKLKNSRYSLTMIV
jgi:hypothetical protein